MTKVTDEQTKAPRTMSAAKENNLRLGVTNQAAVFAELDAERAVSDALLKALKDIAWKAEGNSGITMKLINNVARKAIALAETRHE